MSREFKFNKNAQKIHLHIFMSYTLHNFTR